MNTVGSPLLKLYNLLILFGVLNLAVDNISTYFFENATYYSWPRIKGDMKKFEETFRRFHMQYPFMSMKDIQELAFFAIDCRCGRGVCVAWCGSP